MTQFPQIGQRLSKAQATAFAELAMAGIQREFPYAPSLIVINDTPPPLPRQRHPVFYGCFDWHSAVHSHWLLVRLLKLYGEETAVRPLLNHQFTAAKLQTEADYLAQRPSFERMYGWAWVLRLALELHNWDDADGQQWATNLQPLTRTIVSHIHAYLPRLTWPIRCGFHPESAFPLGQILDYARAVGDTDLASLVVAKSTTFYAADQNYPVAYEPSGHDFFSAGLNEADLMRRILSPNDFSGWLSRFLPGLASGDCGNLLTPAVVSDIHDGALVHLAGLNLSRAWTMHAIAHALPNPHDPRRDRLAEAAASHAEAGLAYVFSGDYMGDHWLASFAVYLLTETGVATPPQSPESLPNAASNPPG